jgi:hypothetical protein
MAYQSAACMAWDIGLLAQDVAFSNTDDKKKTLVSDSKLDI